MNRWIIVFVLFSTILCGCVTDQNLGATEYSMGTPGNETGFKAPLVDILVEDKNIIIGENWYDIELWPDPDSWSGVPVRWISNNATILINSEASEDTTLLFSAQSFYKSRNLQIYLNDKMIHEKEIPASFIDLEIPVRLREGENILRFYTPDGCERPCDIQELENEDGRCLGLAFKSFYIGDTGK